MFGVLILKRYPPRVQVLLLRPSDSGPAPDWRVLGAGILPGGEAEKGTPPGMSPRQTPRSPSIAAQTGLLLVWWSVCLACFLGFSGDSGAGLVGAFLLPALGKKKTQLKNQQLFEGEAPYDKTVPATPEEQPASSSFVGCSGKDSNLQLNHGCCSLSSTAASVPSC